jgi:hypothetical protein
MIKHCVGMYSRQYERAKDWWLLPVTATRKKSELT